MPDFTEARKETSTAGIDFFLPDDWASDLHTLQALYRYLRAQGELIDLEQVDYFWEKPQKWRGELVRMLAEGALEEAA